MISSNCRPWTYDGQSSCYLKPFPLNLRHATDADAATIMSWFGDQQSTRMWGGPHFGFPFDEAGFRRDSRFGAMPGFCLMDGSVVAGFGQYYERFQRCHLARLAIAPGHRGQGLSRVLVSEVVRAAVDSDGFAEVSLYVMPANSVARACYLSLGFRDAEHPDGSEPPETCQYMVAATSELLL